MKPKIGIMTFYAVRNYGAVLQAFALQQSIKSLDGEPELLRFFDQHNESRPSHVKGSKLQILGNKVFRKELLFHFARYLKVRKYLSGNSVAFTAFRNQYLNISREPYYDTEDLLKANSEYQGFVAGSDMVWTPIGQNLDAYLLKFADEDKRFSYAASITGCANFSKEDTERISSLASTFSKLSCREKEGVVFLKNNTSRSVELVCDPTLLLNKSQWKNLLNLKDYHEERPYILCYMFGGVPKPVKKSVRKIAKEKGLIVRYIPSLPEEIYAERSLGYQGACGPREFAELFYNASFVVTNSYHGFLFSLINEKPFLVYHRESNNKWKANEARISDLLIRLDLSGRFVDYYKRIASADLILDYSSVTSKINQFRASSISYLKSIIDEVKNLPEPVSRYDHMHVGYLSHKQCTGCSMCEQICPFHAITMNEDEDGFIYPTINQDYCRKCGKCVSHCPSIVPPSKSLPKNTVLCVSKDKIRENSASGGAFITMAKYYIKDLGGVVYGCVLDDEMNCLHAEASTFDELIPMQNSKYIQSNVSDCYKKVEQRLVEGREVLFSGTPCQIAGLRAYLGKDYEKLLLIEVICHGVPNQRFWKLYLDALRKQGELRAYRFRNRSNRAHSSATLEATIEWNSVIKHVYCLNDPYYGPFVRCESYRPSCYYCQYASKERQADITIGDCDTHRLYQDFYPFEEKSSVLLNTDKGLRIWEKVKDQFYSTHLNYDIESATNTPLSHPSEKPLLREELYGDLKTLTWEDFSKKYADNSSILDKIVRSSLKIVKSLLR